MSDSTIRPQNVGGSSDSTIRPQNAGGNSDSTIRPQNVGGNPGSTVRPQTLIADTDEKTMRQQQQEIANLNIVYEKEYIIDGKRYRFKKALSEGTGEGNILLVEHGGKPFALKIYYPGLKLPDIDILKAVRSTGGQLGLIHLQSFGTWKNLRTGEESAYELMNHCEGGSLAEYKLNGNEEQFKKLAVQMAMCINTCHEKGFLHCDVKPSNFLFVDKNQTRLQLCDFGIAIRTDSNGKAKNRSDARTKIYAAPEFYYSVPGADGRELYRSSDFYSLGMTLLCLWMGEDAFKQQEAELMRLKISGKLPYPPELSDHTLCLLRALTSVDPAVRPTFQQIVEWAKGQNPFAEFSSKKQEEITTQMKIVYNAAKNQVAHSPEELAQFMHEDMELAAKYLYSGKISKWLHDNLRPELEIEMEDIVEKRYPDNHTAGVWAACWILDPDMPYYDCVVANRDDNGKIIDNPCHNEKEIAKAILEERIGYEYELDDPCHPLYIYFQSHGLETLAIDTYKSLTKSNVTDTEKREAVSKLIYALDPDQPFEYYAIKTDSDGQEIYETILCHTIKDVIEARCKYSCEDETWNDFTQFSFFCWVAHRDKNAAFRMKQVTDGYTPEDTSAFPCGIIYALNKNINFYYEFDQNLDYTYQHIAQRLNLMIDAKINPNNYTKSEIEHNDYWYGMLSSFKGSRLYFYLKSKGSYDNWIDWIEYCYDIDSKENTKKAAPYNMWIATYKCVKGMGVDPVYITKSGKRLLKPADAKALSKKELELETSNDRGLQDWLTVFYQEDPALDKNSKKYAFEKKVAEYIEFLGELNSNNDEYQRYNEAKKEVTGKIRSVRSKYTAAVVTRILLALLCFVPLLTMVALLVVLGFPFEGNPIEGHFWNVTWVVALVLFIPICILTELEAKFIGEAFFSLFAAALITGIFRLLLGFLIVVAPYVLALLLLAFAGVILYKCYISLPLKRKTMKQLSAGGDFETIQLEPLHYAFRTNGSSRFESSIADDIDSYRTYLSKALSKLLKFAIPTIAVTAGLFVLMVFLTPRIVAKQNLQTNQLSHLATTWTGNFDGKKSSIDFKRVTENEVIGYVHVKFSTTSNELVKGSINLRKKTMYLEDQVRNGVLDGKYRCSFSDGSLTKITGIYSNPKTGKQLAFEYSRPLSEQEKNVETTLSEKSAWQIWIDIFHQKFSDENVKELDENVKELVRKAS